MSKEEKVYFISGGGTGGHIYPALSVVQELLKRKDTAKIYYIGNPKNMEYDIVKKIDGVEFLPVSVMGLPRKISFGLIKFFFLLFVAVIKAIGYISKYKPDAVFTTGGYVSAPVALVAPFMGVPLMIHDCDAVPGLVSRLAAPRAKVVSVAFESSKSLLKNGNVICTGNPVRSEFLTVPKWQARQKLGLRDKLTIFLTGGSQGAKTLNNTAIKAAQALVEEYDVQFVVQTGKKKYEDFISEIKQYFPNYYQNTNLVIKPYFDEMYYALKAADIVIARAGSLSLSELTLCGSACILVPYPYAAADHQRKNARQAEKMGFALYCEDKDFSRERMLELVRSLIYNPEHIKRMSKNAYANSKPQAKEEIIENLISIIK